MLLDRVPHLKHGNEIVIPAKVTGEIAAASDKGQAALRVVAKVLPGNYIWEKGKDTEGPSLFPTNKPFLVTKDTARPTLFQQAPARHQRPGPRGARAVHVDPAQGQELEQGQVGEAAQARIRSRVRPDQHQKG